MTFAEWWSGPEADKIASDGDQEQLARWAWDAATKTERKRCAKVAESGKHCGIADHHNQCCGCRETAADIRQGGT